MIQFLSRIPFVNKLTYIRDFYNVFIPILPSPSAVPSITPRINDNPDIFTLGLAGSQALPHRVQRLRFHQSNTAVQASGRGFAR